MAFLPIAERELRVAARQSKTWWRRVMTTTVGLVLFVFMLMILGRFRGLNLIGRELFMSLSWVGMIYALLSGPLTTVDCLSSERREGTLGLLFLTDLHSYDVVLGKMAAASLRSVLDLTAVLPLVALPMLMGGVGLGQLAVVALTLVSITFLSLAVATYASALPRSGRSSLAIALGVLFFLTAGLSLVGDAVGVKGQFEPWWYALSPVSAMSKSVGGLLAGHHWEYWLSMGAMNVFGWTCLVLAARRTRHSWRDVPGSARAHRLQEWFEQWRQGSAAARQAWRQFMLSRNPVAWLEGRDRLQQRVLWGILLGVAITGAVGHALHPSAWPDEEFVVVWASFSYYTLCVWIAIQAPRRLADDKEVGALELLLCTPLKPGQIVRGCMVILRRRFGRGLLALIALDLFFAFAYYSEHGGWNEFVRTPLWQCALCVLVVAPVQTYCLARIGVYQGLAETTSLRASFMTAWNAGLLPWISWFAVMLSMTTSQRYLMFPQQITDELAFGAWVSVQMLVCTSCMAYASWRLHWRFRYLAAKAHEIPWWKRWRARVKGLLSAASPPRSPGSYSVSSPSTPW
jgi:ABC-type transport system involved in cytochrome c biogenesis permease component